MKKKDLFSPEHLYTRGDKPIEDTYTHLWPLYIVEININKLKNYDTVKGFIPLKYILILIKIKYKKNILENIMNY